MSPVPTHTACSFKVHFHDIFLSASVPRIVDFPL
jgi:hypothetical protein